MLPILVLAAAVALGVTMLAPFAWLVLLTDGMLPLALVAGAAGWGAWPTAWLGFGRCERGKQFCIATALGLGWLSTLTLALGAAGLLSQAVAWSVAALGAACGLWRVYKAQATASTPPVAPVSDPSAGSPETPLLPWKRSGKGGTSGDSTLPRPLPAREGSNGMAPSCSGAGGANQHHGSATGRYVLVAALLLPLAVPVVVTLFGASLPPGVLWPDEAYGYDVLEYHLQAPREYFDAGRIEFLPHNVYASFPQQMEMLYLLLMHMADDAYQAAIPAQLLHTFCGVLAVLALAFWTPPGWRRCVVLLIAGTTPWVAYLGCLAYVENGLLFFAAVAVGLILDGQREVDGEAWRPALAAGLCAGLAGGCKYTALVFVVAALGGAYALTMRGTPAVRARRLAAFGLGALLAFSPWMVRNAGFTGNPIYPFAYDYFGGAAWSAPQDAQWQAGHRVPSNRDSFAGRFRLAARELFGVVDERDGTFRPSLFGPMLFVLALAGLAFGRSRATALLGIWSALLIAAWMWLTFIPGRFAVVLIAPLALLAARAFGPDATPTPTHSPRGREWIVLMLAFLGALGNDWLLAGRLRDQNRWFEQTRGAPLAATVALTDVFVENHWLNQTLPPDASVWLVGEARAYYVDRPVHYTVAFSRDPWLEFAAQHHRPAECVEWLRQRGVTHVVFVWSEIERLRASYGFPAIVTHEWVAALEQAGLEPVALAPKVNAPTSAAVYRVGG